MKRLIALCSIAFSAFSVQAQESPKYSYEDLEPSNTHKRVEQFATQFLSNYHYQKFQVDDSLSSHVFDNLLQDVDRSHSYFTQADIEEFEEYRFSLDDALLTGDLEFPFMVYNKFRKIYKERYEFINEYLSKPFEFDTDATFDMDKLDERWAVSQEELDDEWSKILLSQALNMKLSGSADSSIAKTLKRRYERYETRVAKLRSEDVFQTYMNSFTEAIDPHTSYMIPSTAAQFNIDMSQSLEGIGAQLRNEDDYVMIVDIIPGGPLFKTQQASKDDYILGVAQGDDGEYQDIIGWLTDDAVKLIRGKKGTVVKLLLRAKDAPANSEPREVRIVREKIKLEEAVAEGEVIELEEDGENYKLGVVDIPMFYRDFDGARRGVDFQSTTKDVKKFLEDFNDQGVDGVIIDLRNNGGGSLTEAINLTGLFIPKGPVVQRRTGRGRIDVENDRDPSVTYDGPLLILQNRYSASASEIFAGAIQDYNRGVIVGEQSFGKGTVQQLVNLDQFLLSPKVASRNNPNVNGIEDRERYGQLKLTTEKFYRITGNSTQRKGVIPDIALPSPWSSTESGESSRPTALPYDEIKSSNFEDQKKISSHMRRALKSNFDSRFAESEDLQTLQKEIEIYKADKDQNEFSLNYDERLKEKEEDEGNRTAIKKLRKTKTGDDHTDDLYLNEASKILTDLIRMS
ncbi:carboxy terminal-processing peptidase [Jiulongibacter sp. NS-SX5]|uniref:carboxy terminal-processing peptidase n=1 Tax=Jiulongibacter sp. NS-SX5 TaxID=3463854 RepID=UPI0040588AF7